MSSTVHHPSLHPPDSQELNASSGEDLVPLKEVMGLLEVRFRKSPIGKSMALINFRFGKWLLFLIYGSLILC